MRIDFYHLTKSPLDTALPKLAEKVYASGGKGLIVTSSKERVEHLDDLLWTYDADSWLPHGSLDRETAKMQPLWITTEYNNPNLAKFIILTDGMDLPEDCSQFERCLDVFDGNDSVAIDAARNRWRKAKKAGHELHYWQQEISGWKEQI